MPVHRQYKSLLFKKFETTITQRVKVLHRRHDISLFDSYVNLGFPTAEYIFYDTSDVIHSYANL